MPPKVNWKERVLTRFLTLTPIRISHCETVEGLGEIIGTRVRWTNGGTRVWAWWRSPSPRLQWWVCSSFPSRHTFSTPFPPGHTLFVLILSKEHV